VWQIPFMRSDPASLLNHTAAAALWVSLPGWLAIAALVIFAQLSWLWALGASAAVYAAAYAIARSGLSALERARRHILDLRSPSREAAGLPVLYWTPARRLAAAAGEAVRSATGEQGRLRRQSEAWSSLLEALPDAVLMIDARRIVLAANPAAAELIGSAAVGSDLAGVLRVPAFTAAIGRVLAERSSAETEFSLHGQSERTLRAILRPLGASPPGEAAAVIVLHDETARVRLDKMRSDFVANVSHELKTPLASLIGFIETLRGAAAEDAEARARFLEIMHDQAGRMRRLVDDIMLLSRAELVEHQPPTERVALLPILQNLMEALQVQALRRRITFALERHVAEDDVLETIGDRDQLLQVFQNLLDNALKYSREGIVVVIRVSRSSVEQAGARGARAAAPPGGWIEVGILDRGEGIAPENIARLTERFYRVDRGRSRQLGGTGLGLAIVKHILNRHSGRLAIESRLGQGSCFTVSLPAA
jgi:two-component system phosphate regulon sensor histidine kinase PhoR